MIKTSSLIFLKHLDWCRSSPWCIAFPLSSWLARLICRHRIATLDRRTTDLPSLAFIKITIITASASGGGSANFMPLKRVHWSIQVSRAEAGWRNMSSLKINMHKFLPRAVAYGKTQVGVTKRGSLFNGKDLFTDHISCRIGRFE